MCGEHASRPSRGGQSRQWLPLLQPRACTIALLGGQGLRVRTREICRRLPGPESLRASQEQVHASLDGTLSGGRLAFCATQGWEGLRISIF